MTNSKPLQLYILAIAAILFSAKLKEKCLWCTNALLVASVALFVWGTVLTIRKNKKIKRLKDKDLL